MNVFVLLNTKEDILKNVGNRAVLGHHWLPEYFFFLLCKSMVPQNSLITSFLQISSFVFGRTKIQVWNYLRVSKWWQNFHFWVNYPFKPFFWSYCRQYMHFTPNKTNVCLPNFSKFLWNDFLFSSGVTLASYSSHLETIYHRTVNSQWIELKPLPTFYFVEHPVSIRNFT